MTVPDFNYAASGAGPPTLAAVALAERESAMSVADELLVPAKVMPRRSPACCRCCRPGTSQSSPA
jgi:hypothetical protein